MENDYRFTHIFCSDLQRAARTANAIYQAQIEQWPKEKQLQAVVTLPLLREQDFGFYEGRPFSARRPQSGSDEVQSPQKRPDDFKHVETKASMGHRMDEFLKDFLTPLIYSEDASEEVIVAVVSHGLILSQLWKRFLLLLPANSVTLGPDVVIHRAGASLEHIGAWSNTGYLELELHRQAIDADAEEQIERDVSSPLHASHPIQILSAFNVFVKTVDGKAHLAGLKRTRGVGSSKYDDNQKTLESFFKKPRGRSNLPD